MKMKELKVKIEFVERKEIRIVVFGKLGRIKV